MIITLDSRPTQAQLYNLLHVTESRQDADRAISLAVIERAIGSGTLYYDVLDESDQRLVGGYTQDECIMACSIAIAGLTALGLLGVR